MALDETFFHPRKHSGPGAVSFRLREPGEGKMKRTSALVCLSLVFVAPSEAAMAKGCIKGAIVGGIAGHYAGRHGVLGAIGGCLYGRHVAREKERVSKPYHFDRHYGRGWL